VIAFVSGPVVALGPDTAVVAVGGVGLSVSCTPTTLARLRVGEPARLPTSLVVREDSLTLYGFVDDDERQLFELLQTASGVGPRLAQAILAVHGPDDVRRAVATEDLAALTQVPGIGRKGAQRIVLELRDRIGPPGSAAGSAAPGRPGAGLPAWRDQVHSALLNLGWSVREADEAIAAVGSVGSAGSAGSTGDPAEPPDVAALLRGALKVLNRA
jgi:Holliday junction DNA helicase RuvA